MSDEPLKAPFPWFGGKSRVAAEVWTRFGADVGNYVEPFFGSGAVLLARPGGPGNIETVNDLDGYIANFWRAVRYATEAHGVLAAEHGWDEHAWSASGGYANADSDRAQNRHLERIWFSPACIPAGPPPLNLFDTEATA